MSDEPKNDTQEDPFGASEAEKLRETIQGAALDISVSIDNAVEAIRALTRMVGILASLFETRI